MMARIRLTAPIAAFLVVFFPCPSLAEDINFSVVPAEVHIDNLLPGQSVEFELTIHNKDDLAHNFTVTTFPRPEEERREGRTQFPDDDWIDFSWSRIEIAASSQANVTVTTAIPGEQKWAGQDWETWLAVTAESSDLLSVRLYVRLLVSTNPATRSRSNIGLIVGIVVALALVGYGVYHYLLHRAKTH